MPRALHEAEHPVQDIGEAGRPSPGYRAGEGRERGQAGLHGLELGPPGAAVGEDALGVPKVKRIDF